MKWGHSSSNSCLFPEISPGQGPSPMKHFRKLSFAQDEKDMSAGNCAVLIFSTRTWTTRSARSCQTALVEKPIWPKRSLLVLGCQSVGNSLTQPSSSEMFNSSYKLILFFSGLINNWTEEKQWDVEHYIYLDFRSFLCLPAKSLQNRDTGKKWIRLTLTSPKHPDSRFGVRWPLLQMLQVMTWRESRECNH